MSQKIYQYKWEGMDKTTKRNTLKSLVYLDALVTLYRMPPQFEFAISDLSERFRGMPEEVLMDILQLPAIIQGQQKRVKVTDKKTNTPKIPCMILTPATDANPNPIQHKNNCPLRSPQSRHVRKHIGHIITDFALPSKKLVKFRGVHRRISKF